MLTPPTAQILYLLACLPAMGKQMYSRSGGKPQIVRPHDLRNGPDRL